MLIYKRLLLGFLLFWALTVGSGEAIQHKTALAATLPPGYSLSVTESASAKAYGDNSVSMRAHLTVPSDDPLTNQSNFYIKIDSQAFVGFISGVLPTYSIYLANVDSPGPLPVGQHAVVAVYWSLKMQVAIESDPLTLTVNKASPLVNCGIVNWANTYAPNTLVTITISLGQVNIPIDWQNVTFTITFTGKQTFTRANLKVNNSQQVTVPLPPTPDVYQAKCIFNGTSTLSSATAPFGTPTVIVSTNHRVGGITLYTNPTTTVAGEAATWDVVVSPAPGLPIPAGYISFRIGSSFTNIVALGPDGTSTNQLTVPSPLAANTITVFYNGDPTYAASSANFPLTNPPIPAGGNQPPSHTEGTPTANTPGISATPTSGATATSTPKAAATATSTTTSTETTAALTGNHPSGPSSGQGSLVLWIILATLVILAGGGAAGFFVLRTRPSAAKTSINASPFDKNA